MQDRYRMYCRAGGNYFTQDKISGKRESLKTADRAAARQILAAKNQAADQPQLNRAMAKAYLSAKSPELLTRTWADVMEHYICSGEESTKERKQRAFKSRPFAMLRKIKLMDTEAIHLLTVLEHKQAGNSAHHYLRRLHNFALHIGWLLAPVMANAAWPTVRKKKFTAITEEEHERIVAKEGNLPRKLYYQLLWETGGSQTDIANLSWDQINLEEGVIRFTRRKLLGKESGGESLLRIGERIREILAQLPQEGGLFPQFKHDPVRLLIAAGENFPDPRDAIRLKEFLIFPNRSSPSEESIDRALASLTFLFERREADAYSEVKFDVTGLAQELWDRKRDWVIWQLGRLAAQDNVTGSTFISAIANIIDPRDLPSVADQNSDVALLLIQRRNELAFYPSSWTMWGRTQQQIFDILSRQSLTEEDWSKVLGAMLIAATYISVRQVVEKAGNSSMPGAFRWLEDPVAQSHLPSQPWRDALAYAARDFLRRVDRIPVPQLALAAWFCPTEAIRSVLRSDRGDVNELANSLRVLPPPLITPTAFLLLTFGLRADDLHGLPLIVRSFDIVNQALASKEYPRESWDLLSPILPFIGYRRDWDRCAKLKLAVHKWMEKHAGKIDSSLEDVVREVNRSVAEASGMHQENEDY